MSSPPWPRGAPHVGQRAERSRAIVAADILRFTAISGDRDPLHHDEAFAKGTRLRTTVTRGDGTVALEGTALCYTVTPEG